MISRIITIIFFLIPVIIFSQYTNQAGFDPGAVKHVFFEKEYSGQSFEILDADNKLIMKNVISKNRKYPLAGRKFCHADISALKSSGRYSMKIGTKLIEINVDEHINRDVGSALLKSFYHARVSEPILDEFAGEYARPIGHPDDSVIIHKSAASDERPEGTVIPSPGGWYDAGDYNKYIVNSGISTFTLLHVYEMFKEDLSALRTDIPESNNLIPDILDESLVNLKWMFTMQDPNDGGVYHKLTSLSFCGMIPPHEDHLDRYVVYKTSSATLNFAAVFAKAARIFKDFEKELPGLAETYIDAAIKAYRWAEKYPDILYSNPPDVNTGEYSDSDLLDEWFWASVELFLSTGNKAYLKNIDFDEQEFTVPSWRRTNMLAVYSLLESEKEYGNLLKKEDGTRVLFNIAEAKFHDYKKSAFKVPIDTFPWGSNGEIANDGFLSLVAYKYLHNPNYLETAAANANYILGANPLGKCFVTGFGINPPKHLHDRRCASDGIETPIPGLVAGGPSRAARQDCGINKYNSNYPALSYLDEQCSYSTNEIAINWNSAATALFLGLHFSH